MKQNTILLAVIALLIGGIGVYMVINDSDENDRAGMMSNRDSGEKGERDEMDGMHMMPDGTMMGNDSGAMGSMNGMDHSMMMVSSEREFLAGMIPHHQEAVDTAKEVLERGGSTDGVRSLATNIITAQEREIAMMKGWYEDWYGETYEPTGEYGEMMRELQLLSGSELDTVFLEDMVAHHMGAIMMAQSVQPYIEHDEIRELTKAINETQAKEIVLMRQLLQELE